VAPYQTRLHRLDAIPDGMKISDLLPVFSDVKGDIHVGAPNEDCAACRKPFNMVRKPRKSIRVYHVNTQIPIAFQYRVCGACLALYQRGGDDRDAFLAAVEAFHDGEPLEALS